MKTSLEYAVVVISAVTGSVIFTAFVGSALNDLQAFNERTFFPKDHLSIVSSIQSKSIKPEQEPAIHYLDQPTAEQLCQQFKC